MHVLRRWDASDSPPGEPPLLIWQLSCGSQRSPRLMTRCSVWMSQHEAEGRAYDTQIKTSSRCCHGWGKLSQVGWVFLLQHCVCNGNTKTHTHTHTHTQTVSQFHSSDNASSWESFSLGLKERVLYQIRSRASRIYLYSPTSQVTNLLGGALRSVQHTSAFILNLEIW